MKITLNGIPADITLEKGKNRCLAIYADRAVLTSKDEVFGAVARALPNKALPMPDTQAFLAERQKNDPRYQNLPANTQALLTYFSNYELPVFIGPNTAHTLEGCDDAVLVRDRIIAAQESVPLYDELKSLLLEVPTENQRAYIMVHLRGNRTLDWDKVRELLSQLQVSDTPLSKKKLKSLKAVSPEDLKEKFNLEKGQVTPWVEAHRDFFDPAHQSTPIYHLFDSDCLKSFGLGMTTNAHDGDWATEFDPAVVIPILEQSGTVLTADITQNGPSTVLKSVDKYRNTTIGVIEYGAEATALFRRKLDQYRRQHLASLQEANQTAKCEEEETIPLSLAGTFSEPTVNTASSGELEKIMSPAAYQDEVSDRVNQLVRNMVAQGSNLILVPCNILPRYVINYYGKNNVRMPSINEALQEFFEEESVDKKSSLLLGGASAHNPDSSIYPDFLESKDPLNADDIENIERAMLKINNGNFKEADQLLFEVLRQHQQAKTIIIAATSFSVAIDRRGLLIDPNNLPEEARDLAQAINSKTQVDTLDVYAKYSVKKMFTAD